MAIENTYISSPSLLIIVEWAEKKKEWRETGHNVREREREKSKEKHKKLRKYLYKLASSTYKALKQVKEGGFEKGNSANLGREDKLEEKQ